jgi:hypothetical protein
VRRHAPRPLCRQIHPQQRFDEPFPQMNLTPDFRVNDMQTMTDIDQDKRRKNIRTAWILAGFVALIMISSVPFWKGLAKLAAGN